MPSFAGAKSQFPDCRTAIFPDCPVHSPLGEVPMSQACPSEGLAGGVDVSPSIAQCINASTNPWASLT